MNNATRMNAARIGRTALAMALAAGLAACTTTAPGNDRMSQAELNSALSTMFSGRPQIDGEELARLVEQASSEPLGSEMNPVRAAMPAGQRAYLSRLRCADLSTPTFGRVGNVGMGAFGNITDLYRVDCGDAEPGMVEVYMDMYHPDHRETEAVPGFGITGGRSAGDSAGG